MSWVACAKRRWRISDGFVICTWYDVARRIGCKVDFRTILIDVMMNVFDNLFIYETLYSFGNSLKIL